jgi:hypothetical protein
MGQMQNKGGSKEQVCSTIKSIESGSNNMDQGNSPIYSGGSSASSHPGFNTSGFKSGQSPNSVVRKKN